MIYRGFQQGKTGNYCYGKQIYISKQKKKSLQLKFGLYNVSVLKTSVAQLIFVHLEDLQFNCRFILLFVKKLFVRGI